MDQPYAEPIALKLEEYDRFQEENDKHHRIETAKKAFQDKWVKETELKLFDLVNQKTVTQDKDTLDGINGMIEILQHKLKSHHSKMGTWNMKEALQARKNFCKEMGILQHTKEDQIVSLTCLVPSRKEDSDDDEAMFVTPATSPLREKRRAATQVKRNKSKKHKQQTNTLTKYFSQN